MDIFPFETIREGQKDFMKDVEKAINEGKNLIAHAPAGIGKTAAVIAPSLKDSLESGRTIFFLTPKHTQHIIVIDTLQRIKNKFKTNVIAVDIVGKQWTCPFNVRNLSSREFNEFCKAKKKDELCKYYNNVRKGKLSKNSRNIIKEIKNRLMHSEEIKEICLDNMLCPYEICIEVGRDANVIICDYFHIFSQPIRKAFLSKLQKDIKNSIIIVDEAHNLPERVRNIMSYNLTEYSLRQASLEAKILGHDQLQEDFIDILKILKEFGKGMKPDEEKFVKKDDFIEAVSKKLNLKYEEFIDRADELGDKILKIPNRHRSYSNTVAKFLENWIGPDIGFARILKKYKFTALSYRCLDPSISCKEIFENSHSAILMSGTLFPLEMYLNVLGLNPGRTVLKEYKSPFPKENRLLLLIPGITTKYSKRSEFMYGKYARIMSEIIDNVPGNVAVFFPSYNVLESVKEHLSKYKISKELLIETQEMKKEERKYLYNRLIALNDNNGGILMGVQAGSLSEGVDYPDNLLNSVIVVGLPLEKPDLEIKALMDFYDFKFNRGWDYGYIYPAMSRALQAAGRCIRSETDRGAIILMDERFRWKNYYKCFPSDYDIIITETPIKYIKKFFDR